MAIRLFNGEISDTTSGAQTWEDNYGGGIERKAVATMWGTLTGAEQVVLEYSLDGGNTWVGAIDSSGVAVTLTTTVYTAELTMIPFEKVRGVLTGTSSSVVYVEIG